MTDADTHRSTPGYRYGVGMHMAMKDGEMLRQEVEPPCSCPCHLARAPYPSSWYCGKCHAMQMRWTSEDRERVSYTHDQAIADGREDPEPYTVGVVDYYFITRGNNLLDAFPRRHFKTEEAANRAADKLNAADVVASLNLTPTALVRRERLKRLGMTFWASYGEGHPEARLPREPGRYAVEEYSERYSESFWDTHQTLDEVREAIEGGDVERVVDLDTGEDVPFTVSVQVGIGRDPA